MNVVCGVCVNTSPNWGPGGPKRGAGERHVERVSGEACVYDVTRVGCCAAAPFPHAHPHPHPHEIHLHVHTSTFPARPPPRTSALHASLHTNDRYFATYRLGWVSTAPPSPFQPPSLAPPPPSTPPPPSPPLSIPSLPSSPPPTHLQRCERQVQSVHVVLVEGGQAHLREWGCLGGGCR